MWSLLKFTCQKAREETSVRVLRQPSRRNPFLLHLILVSQLVLFSLSCLLALKFLIVTTVPVAGKYFRWLSDLVDPTYHISNDSDESEAFVWPVAVVVVVLKSPAKPVGEDLV